MVAPWRKRGPGGRCDLGQARCELFHKCVGEGMRAADEAREPCLVDRGVTSSSRDPGPVASGALTHMRDIVTAWLAEPSWLDARSFEIRLPR